MGLKLVRFSNTNSPVAVSTREKNFNYLFLLFGKVLIGFNKTIKKKTEVKKVSENTLQRKFFILRE